MLTRGLETAMHRAHKRCASIRASSKAPEREIVMLYLTKTRFVRFNDRVQVALVPSHRDLDEATLDRLWWTRADMTRFRYIAAWHCENEDVAAEHTGMASLGLEPRPPVVSLLLGTVGAAADVLQPASGGVRHPPRREGSVAGEYGHNNSSGSEKSCEQPKVWESMDDSVRQEMLWTYSTGVVEREIESERVEPQRSGAATAVVMGG